MPESLRQPGSTDGACSASRGSSTACPRQSEEALGLSLSMDRAAGIVCSAPAARESERSSCPKPRPEWVQGKRVSSNNHRSSATGPSPREKPSRQTSQYRAAATWGSPGQGGETCRPAAQPSIVEPGRSSRDSAESTRCLSQLTLRSFSTFARNPGPSRTSAKCR